MAESFRRSNSPRTHSNRDGCFRGSNAVKDLFPCFLLAALAVATVPLYNETVASDKAASNVRFSIENLFTALGLEDPRIVYCIFR